MPSKNEDLTVKENELVFLLAIAGRIDAQAKWLATILDKNRLIYHAFAITDGLSCSFSTFKYLFEVCISHSNDPRVMHEFLTSPLGVAAVVGETLFILGFCLLASLFEFDSKAIGEKSNQARVEKQSLLIKKFISAAWVYFRHILKGMKNSYRAVKSFAQISSLLGVVDIRHLIIPLGLTVGVLATINRFVQQYFSDKHKAVMKEYGELEKQIEISKIDDNYAIWVGSFKDQNPDILAASYVSKALGGVFDSLYLYAGLLSLAPFNPVAFMVMVIITGFYALSCMVFRVYEGYEDQLKHSILKHECLLKLEGTWLQSKYDKLIILQQKQELTVKQLEEIAVLKSDICKSIVEFDRLHNLLKNKKNSSFINALFTGMSYGLKAYGVLTAFLFMFCALSLLSLPPVFLIACIVSGLGFMLVFASYTVYAQHQYVQENAPENDALNALFDIRKKIEFDSKANFEDKSYFSNLITTAQDIPEAPSFKFTEWMEIGRTFFSGLSKGNNFINFVTTPIQEPDQQVVDRDSPWMVMLLVTHTALFALILSFRSLTKGLKPKPSDQQEEASSSAVSNAEKPNDFGEKTKRSNPSAVSPAPVPSTPSIASNTSNRPITNNRIIKKLSESTNSFLIWAKQPHSPKIGSTNTNLSDKYVGLN